MYIQEKAHYVKGVRIEVVVHWDFYFSHQPFSPTKGTLGIVGADRPRQRLGQCGVQSFGAGKSNAALLWPRPHKIHHGAVPGKVEAKEETQTVCSSSCWVMEWKEREGTGWRRPTHRPEWTDRFWPTWFIIAGPVGPNALGGPGLSRPGQPPSQTWESRKAMKFPEGGKPPLSQ